MKSKGTKHYFFLFKCQDKDAGSFYGDYYRENFFKHYIGLNNELPTLLSHGDLIMRANHYDISKVIHKEKYKEIQSVPNYSNALKGVGYIINYLNSMPNFLNASKYWKELVSCGCYIIGASTRIEIDLDGINNSLKNEINGYIGCFEFKSFDPLMYQIFFESLYRDTVLDSGKLIHGVYSLEECWMPFIDERFAKELGASIIAIENYKLKQSYDQLNTMTLNEYQDSYKLKSLLKRNLDQKIMEASFYNVVTEDEIIVDSSAYRKLNQLEIGVDKIREYVLNHQHEKGKHKAKLFKELLGIGSENWEYLINEINRSLDTLEILKVKNSNYGIKFEATIDLIGKNNVAKTFFSVWMLKDGEGPKLVTIYPVSRKKQKEYSEPGENFVVENVEPLSRKLYQILKTAVDFAEEQARCFVSEPIILEDTFGNQEIFSPGFLGKACIFVDRVKYAEFSEVLVEHCENARIEDESVVIDIYRNGYSLDEAITYAKCFIGILKLNGIIATYTSVKD